MEYLGYSKKYWVNKLIELLLAQRNNQTGPYLNINSAHLEIKLGPNLFRRVLARL